MSLAAVVVIAGGASAAPRCDALSRLDRSAFTALTAAEAARAREVLLGGDAPDLGDADTVIRFHAPPGFGGSGSTWTTARRVDGVWRFVREDLPMTPPPPPPPSADEMNVSDMRGSRERRRILYQQGRLEPDRAAVIEAALNDPCLSREPDVGLAALPLRGGRLEPCFDGATFFLQIETAGGVRTFVHHCTPRWRAGTIMRALETARGVAGDVTLTEGLAPKVYVDESGNDVVDPALIRTEPLRLGVSGDGATRPLTITIAGRTLYDSRRDPAPDASGWRYFPPINPPPASMRITPGGCSDPAVLDVPEADGVLVIEGCKVVWNGVGR
ncbi:MAG: hypothetical protein Q8L66_14155 [Caulobacter sp.]|nr:hypothetical protein [Caulobacter sp.]